MASLYETRREQMFPKLTAAQIARLERHGRRYRTTAGQLLSEAGSEHRDMRAFILRRMGLVAADQSGDVILVGSMHSSATLRLVQFLTRNTYPFVLKDVDTDPEVGPFLQNFHLSAADLPVVVCGGEVALKPVCQHTDRCHAGEWAARTGSRAPLHLETTKPGIFAVGDVRCGSSKRVAAAVGEGSVCVQLIHRLLSE
jgi:hypothetical protein